MNIPAAAHRRGACARNDCCPTQSTVVIASIRRAIVSGLSGSFGEGRPVDPHIARRSRDRAPYGPPAHPRSTRCFSANGSVKRAEPACTSGVLARGIHGFCEFNLETIFPSLPFCQKTRKRAEALAGTPPRLRQARGATASFTLKGNRGVFGPSKKDSRGAPVVMTSIARPNTRVHFWGRKSFLGHFAAFKKKAKTA